MSNKLRVLTSQEDASVNFVHKAPIGFFESRYVHRPGSNYFICYLSSQSGCNRGCQFCHLTKTQQTISMDAVANDFLTQAHLVFDHAVALNMPNKVDFVHFNFMARGEFFANDSIFNNDRGITEDDVLADLGRLAARYGLNSKFNISTIMPKTFKGSLLDVFRYMQPTIYYSLYSVDPLFRTKWLPGAMDVDKAFEKLKVYQEFTQKPIKLHWAYIDGENDDRVEASFIVRLIKKYGLNVDINIVRYNPPDDTSRESPFERIQRLVDYFAMNLGRPIQIVKRVGYDVKASCGMFVDRDFEV